jgi:23S rRNA pseudouridine1911/1915/1917 synthase
MVDEHRLLVPADLGGARADKIVATMLGISRAAARVAFEEEDVLVGDRSVAPAERIPAGETLSVRLAPAPATPQAVPLKVTVVYQDATVIVVDKPPGLVVHPGAGHVDDTLLNGLLYAYPELSELGEGHRWGLVHRLDRDTSGLLMVGRTAAAHSSLQQALRQRRVARRYLALVWGRVDSATGTIDAPIGRDPAHPTRMAVARGGRAARTHYRRVAVWPEVTLLEVTLETGRTHQIRVHLSSIDHPVIGDSTYGRGGPAEIDPGRVWLHAAALTFPHPQRGRDVTVTSPLPSDLAATLPRLGVPLGGAVPPTTR